jgi:hypothetical protein
MNAFRLNIVLGDQGLSVLVWVQNTILGAASSWVNLRQYFLKANGNTRAARRHAALGKKAVDFPNKRKGAFWLVVTPGSTAFVQYQNLVSVTVDNYFLYPG